LVRRVRAAGRRAGGGGLFPAGRPQGRRHPRSDAHLSVQGLLAAGRLLALRGLPGQGAAAETARLVLRQLPVPGLRRRAQRHDVHRRAEQQGRLGVLPGPVAVSRRSRAGRPGNVPRRRGTDAGTAAESPGDPDDPLPVAGAEGLWRCGRRRAQRRPLAAGRSPEGRAVVRRRNAPPLEAEPLAPPYLVGLLLDERRHWAGRRGDRSRHGRRSSPPRLRSALDPVLPRAGLREGARVGDRLCRAPAELRFHGAARAPGGGAATKRHGPPGPPLAHGHRD